MYSIKFQLNDYIMCTNIVNEIKAVAQSTPEEVVQYLPIKIRLSYSVVRLIRLVK